MAMNSDNEDNEALFRLNRANQVLGFCVYNSHSGSSVTSYGNYN